MARNVKRRKWWPWVIGVAAFGAIALTMRRAFGAVDPAYFSKFYTLTNVRASETARRLGIDNRPNDAAITNARRLAQTVLDPLVEFTGQQPRVNSWYRSRELNQAVGGSSTSDHLTGAAVDLTFADKNNNFLIVRAILALELPVDQIIVYGGMGANKYVHVGLDPALNDQQQRRQLLMKTDSGYQAISQSAAQLYYL